VSRRGVRHHGRSRSAAFALLAGCLSVLLAAAPAVAADALGLNGPGRPEAANLILGDLTVSSPQGCTLSYAVQVFTESGGGDDSFELQVVDDGEIVLIHPLTAPADGAVHQLSGSIRLGRSVSQAFPGVGVYLIDTGVILDAVDPVDIVCGVVEIPTLGSAGAWLLGGLLLACGFVVLRRSPLSSR
jgi:hypothetical protein